MPDDVIKRALVLAPHPDDESIGCGGTLRGQAIDAATDVGPEPQAQGCGPSSSGGPR